MYRMKESNTQKLRKFSSVSGEIFPIVVGVPWMGVNAGASCGSD